MLRSDAIDPSNLGLEQRPGTQRRAWPCAAVPGILLLSAVVVFGCATRRKSSASIQSRDAIAAAIRSTVGHVSARCRETAGCLPSTLHGERDPLADEATANAIQLAAPGVLRTFEGVCELHPRFDEVQREVDRDTRLDSFVTWVTLAETWHCADARSTIQFTALAQALGRSSHRLLADTLGAQHAPYDTEERALLLQEIASPTTPEAREAMIGAALRGTNSLVAEIPWNRVRLGDAVGGAMRVGYLTRDELVAEIGILLHSPFSSATAVAIEFALRLPPSSSAVIEARHRANEMPALIEIARGIEEGRAVELETTVARQFAGFMSARGGPLPSS